MISEPRHDLDKHRRSHPYLGMSPDGSNYGYFELQSGPTVLRIISSGNGGEWEHVSVSCHSRCPTWEEMCRVKKLFWDDFETVVQFHPSEAEYVNHHKYCLHLWKLRDYEFALPPRELIA